MKQAAERRMTVKEVAAALDVSENTIRRSLNALFPDLAKNGKVTLIVEALKQGQSQGGKRAAGGKPRLALPMQGIETGQSRALRIDLLHRHIEAELEAEITAFFFTSINNFNLKE